MPQRGSFSPGPSSLCLNFCSGNKRFIAQIYSVKSINSHLNCFPHKFGHSFSYLKISMKEKWIFGTWLFWSDVPHLCICSWCAQITVAVNNLPFTTVWLFIIFFTCVNYYLKQLPDFFFNYLHKSSCIAPPFLLFFSLPLLLCLSLSAWINEPMKVKCKLQQIQWYKQTMKSFIQFFLTFVKEL